MDVTHPQLEYAFEVLVDLAPYEHIDEGDSGLGFTAITGGTVDGPRLQGTVVPGGGDWSVRRGPGLTELDARYLLRASDGAPIAVVNRGFWRASPEVEARAEAGDPVDESEYYFRTSPVFRTGAPAHRWLAENVFVGLASDAGPDRIRIRFFTVL